MTQRIIRMPARREFQPVQPVDGLNEQVRRRAYELYEARGGEDGHDVDDWLRAESEIAQQQSKALAA